LEFSDLAGAWVRGKYQLPGECRGCLARRRQYGSAAIVGGSVELAEREGQQARAQQHQAGCRQRQKSVGYEVVLTHDPPATSDAVPN